MTHISMRNIEPNEPTRLPHRLAILTLSPLRPNMHMSVPRSILIVAHHSKAAWNCH